MNLSIFFDEIRGCNNSYHNKTRHVHKSDDDHSKEPSIIFLTNTVIYPNTVMIEIYNASIASSTMFGAIFAETLAVLTIKLLTMIQLKVFLLWNAIVLMVFVPFISIYSRICRIQTRSCCCGYDHKNHDGKVYPSHKPIVLLLKEIKMDAGEINYNFGSN